jgi:iron complex outermembrane recepter protein
MGGGVTPLRGLVAVRFPRSGREQRPQQKRVGEIHMMSRHTLARAASGVALCACLGWTATASAQETGAPKIEEVVVTAQKRSENIQSVAATVTVVDSKALQARGVGDLRGVTAFVPMVNLNQENSVTQVFIRGIGQTSDSENNDPAVATNIDGVYASRFTLSGSLFDVDRVEVLAGPQGTLYGRNAAGGAVNVTTKTPGSTFGGEGLVEYGNFNFLHGFAAADLPLRDDLAVRVAVDAARRDGYMSNGQNDLNSFAARLTARYAPTAALTVIARVEVQKMDSGGDAIVNLPFIRPNDPWYQPDAPGENYFTHREVQKVSAELNYHLGGSQNIQITYIPSYTYYFYNYSTPIGAPVSYYGDPGKAGFPLAGFAATLTADDRARQQTHELRISGDTERLKWVAGAYVFQQTANGRGASFNILNPGVFAGGPGQPYAFQSAGPATVFKTQTHSTALFGQATASLTDTFRLTGGLRYTDDDRHTEGTAQSLVPIAHIALPQVDYNLRLSGKRWDWKAGLEYNISPNSMAYASVQTGYIGGGFNVTAATATATTFRPETLLAYTVGIKNTLWDRRLRLNAEAFYYDYRDLQVSAYNLATGSALLYNVPKSEIYGAQIEAALRLGHGLRLDGSVGFLHSQIKEAVLPPAAVYSCAVPGQIPAALCSANSLIDYSGLSLPNSPKLSGSLSVTQDWDLNDGAQLSANVGGNFQSSSWGLFSHIAGTRRPAYAKFDASLTYRAKDRKWSVAAWVKNIGNTATYVTPATSSVYGLTSWFIDPPRTYGVRVGYEF